MTPAATATARDGTSERKKAPTKTAIERATQPWERWWKAHNGVLTVAFTT